MVRERKAIGDGTGAKAPLVIEIDKENARKDIGALDIEIPVLTPRVYREYQSLGALDVSAMGHQRLLYLQFSAEEQREIVFKDIATGEITHTTILDTAGVADYRSVIGYFAQSLMKDLRLVSGYDVLYGKIKVFVQNSLFDRTVELEDPNTLRNLSELAATKLLTLDYVNAQGDMGTYYPDFLVKLSDRRMVVAETKGQADLDVPLKMARLRQWCEDINRVQDTVKFDFVYVDEESFATFKPSSFRQLLDGFKGYKGSENGVE